MNKFVCRLNLDDAEIVKGAKDVNLYGKDQYSYTLWDNDLRHLYKIRHFFQKEAIDMYWISLMVFYADRKVSRINQPDAWTRNIEVFMPVLCIEKWQQNKKLLEQGLDFLTGDYWTFHFRCRNLNDKEMKVQYGMKRRKYVYELFKYIKSKYPLIELPLHYDFKDIAAIQTLGIFVEMWHTHITRKKLISKDISPSLRYNTSYASRFVNIKIDKDYSNFDFSQAIHGTKEEIKLRSENAINLINDNKAIIVSAYDNKTNKKVAATIISYDKKCAYYLHCYREKDSIRGVVPLMILKAIDYAFDELKIQIFDFEGAVIQGIDKFLSTFNVEIVPYGYLYYAKDKEEYKDLVFSTIDIEGRIENE